MQGDFSEGRERLESMAVLAFGALALCVAVVAWLT